MLTSMCVKGMGFVLFWREGGREGGGMVDMYTHYLLGKGEKG